VSRRASLPPHGGCPCGGVRLERLAPPLKTSICHGFECRKQSASAFGISVIVRAKSFALAHGGPQRWCHHTDSGRTHNCNFCPLRLARLAWRRGETTISIRGGSLDAPVDVRAAAPIETARKSPGVISLEHAEQHALRARNVPITFGVNGRPPGPARPSWNRSPAPCRGPKGRP
jgi:hypothetical protein